MALRSSSALDTTRCSNRSRVESHDCLAVRTLLGRIATQARESSAKLVCDRERWRSDV